MNTTHVPVLLQETIRGLDITSGDIILDATLGGAGHAKALIGDHTDITLIGLDADGDALARAQENLGTTTAKLILEKENFRHIDHVLEKHQITHLNKALFDLGVGSHTYESGRGFSFQKDEPLVMTLDSEGGEVNASVVVNEWSEETIADIIYGFGEDRFSRRIARAIIESRETKPITTSGELAEIVYQAYPMWARFGKIHPATKTFQAIRMAVNDELNALQEGLQKTWMALEKGGKIAVITFHSLEDRIVKRYFRTLSDSETGKLLSKKPIVPTEDEVRENPRSRSAKLRLIEKII
jgi:16S rRNA (cytosine1402-N4)-methyltransferase